MNATNATLPPIDRVLRCRGLADFIELLRIDSRYRTPEFCAKMANTIDASRILTPNAARVLTWAHAALDEILAALNAIPTLHSLSDLGHALNENTWFDNPGFTELVAGIVDASDTPPELKATLRRYQNLKQEGVRRLILAQQWAGGRPLTKDEKGDVTRNDFLSWLAAVAAARSANDEEEASRIWHFLNWLEDPDGRRLSSGQAESWFFIPEWLVPLRELALRVIDGRSTLSAALRRAKALAERSFVGGPERTRRLGLTLAPAALLVLLASRGIPQLTRDAIAQFRELALASRKHDDRTLACLWTYRYGSLVFQISPFLGNSEEDLRVLSEDVRWAVDNDEHERAGLTRDLYLLQARILRERCRYDPTLAHNAVQSFRDGLAVFGARFDREARGRGITDLAGALLCLPRSEQPAPSSILNHYRVALSLLPAEEFPVSRCTTLTNCAIFLNDRMDGLRAAHQERALSYLEQAVAILEGLPNGDERDDPHSRQVLAFSYQTQGNVLRARTFGAYVHGELPLSVIRSAPSMIVHPTLAAIVAYERALALLGKDGSASQQGLLHLNLGYTYMEAHAPDLARYNLDEAIARLTNMPRERSLARVARFKVTVATNERPTPEELAEVVRAIATLHAWHDAVGEGKALMTLGEFEQKNDSDFERFSVWIEYYQAAALAFAQAEDWPDAASSHHVIADAYVRLAAERSVDGREALHRRALDHIIRAETCSAKAFELGTSLGWTLSLGSMMAFVSAHRLWLEVQLGAEPTVVELCRLAAKSSELTRHQSEIRLGERGAGSGDDVRRLARIFESELWKDTGIGSRQTRVEILEQALEEHTVVTARAEFLKQAASESALTLDVADAAKDTYLIDVTPCRWGTVVLCKRGAQEVHRALIPLNLDDIARLQHEWDQKYRLAMSAEARPSDLTAWCGATDALIASLGRILWQPALGNRWAEFRDANITLVPGRMYNLPLHAASVDGDSLLSLSRSLAWSPRGSVVPRRAPPTRALLVLSNSDDTVLLPYAVDEVARLADCCRDAGVVCTILAAYGDKVGREVFERHHLADEILVVSERPTVQWLRENLANYDLFVYTGHATARGALNSSLQLTTWDGKPEPWDLLDMLSSAAMSPNCICVLSACETTRETDLSEPLSIASGLLRLGAAAVLGNLWAVADDVAPQVSVEFVRLLLRGEDAPAAFSSVMKRLSTVMDDVTQWGQICLWLHD